MPGFPPAVSRVRAWQRSRRAANFPSSCCGGILWFSGSFGGAFRTMCQLLLALFPLRNRERRSNKANMSEGLRKIAQSVPAIRINFFPVETQIIRVSKELLKERLGLIERAATQGEEFRLPKATQGKSALPRYRRVTKQQTVAGS